MGGRTLKLLQTKSDCLYSLLTICELSCIFAGRMVVYIEADWPLCYLASPLVVLQQEEQQGTIGNEENVIPIHSS